MGESASRGGCGSTRARPSSAAVIPGRRSCRGIRPEASSSRRSPATTTSPRCPPSSTRPSAPNRWRPSSAGSAPTRCGPKRLRRSRSKGTGPLRRWLIRHSLQWPTKPGARRRSTASSAPARRRQGACPFPAPIGAPSSAGPASISPASHRRPRRSRPSSPIRRRAPSTRSSSGSSLRVPTARSGPGIGSTSSATPTPPARRPTIPSRSPGATATTASTPSTAISPTTSFSATRSPATSAPRRAPQRPVTNGSWRPGFLPSRAASASIRRNTTTSRSRTPSTPSGRR